MSTPVLHSLRNANLTSFHFFPERSGKALFPQNPADAGGGSQDVDAVLTVPGAVLAAAGRVNETMSSRTRAEITQEKGTKPFPSRPCWLTNVREKTKTASSVSFNSCRPGLPHYLCENYTVSEIHIRKAKKYHKQSALLNMREYPRNTISHR